LKYSDLKTKKEKIAFLKEKLSANPVWAVRGMMKIYEYQTEAEKDLQGTVDDNGVGFSGCDGDIMSSFSKQVEKGRALSQKQMAIVFKKMPKYARQLMLVADAS
jgi:hypothetical protein